MCWEKSFDCVNVKILILRTSNRIFISAYLFVMKVEMLNRIDCKLENSKIDKSDGSEHFLGTVDQLMRGIDWGWKNKGQREDEWNCLLNAIFINMIVYENKSNCEPGKKSMNDQRKNLEDTTIMFLGM